MYIYIYAHNYYISPWHSREYILHMSILYTYIYISLAFQGIHTTYKCVTYTETHIYILYYVSPWHSEGYIPTQVYPMFPAASSVS